MCTVLVSIDPHSPVPVLLAGVRDEFSERPWRAPGAHWPQWPDVLAGQDLRAGGTWFAVDPRRARVAAILNGFGRHAAEDVRLSRGELPLRAAAEGLAPRDLDRYDPFHLLLATASGVRLWSWDGTDLVDQSLTPGLHIVANTGLDGVGHERFAPPAAASDIAARLAYFGPRLLAARRPEPRAGSTAQAWGDWLPLIAGDGLDPADARALLVRREFPESGVWGSSSVSLAALTPEGVRYDFAPVPELRWERIK
ncbi:MAG: hypothetical protein HOV79_26210 [Hamadaea sp.]|nr:hypothetical protein [Hamadaea sp.]